MFYLCLPITDTFCVPRGSKLCLTYLCFPHTTYCTNIPSAHVLLHFSHSQTYDIYFPKIYPSTEIDSSCDNVYNFPVAGIFHQVSTFRNANLWLINESLWMWLILWLKSMLRRFARCETEHGWSSWIIRKIRTCWKCGGENDFTGRGVTFINRVNSSR